MIGAICEKKCFCPQEIWNISPKNFYYQNGSEWSKMDLKHKFLKCKILSARTPEQKIVLFFLKASLTFKILQVLRYRLLIGWGEIPSQLLETSEETLLESYPQY